MPRQTFTDIFSRKIPIKTHPELGNKRNIKKKRKGTRLLCIKRRIKIEFGKKSKKN